MYDFGIGFGAGTPQGVNVGGNAAAGSQTYQSGDRTGGKHGIKGGKERLWGDEYGGGFLDRSVLDPALLEQLQQHALGQAPSAAEMLMRAGLGQQQGQAYGLAAGARGMSPALAMRQAQQAAGQAGLQSQAQFGAMRAEEMARAQQLYAQMQLGEQGLNDAAASAREQMLTQLVMANYQGANAAEMQGEAFWQNLLGQAVGGAVGGVAAGATGGLFSGASAAGGGVAAGATGGLLSG